MSGITRTSNKRFWSGSRVAALVDPKERVDDWDKSVLFCVGARPRRSTSSLEAMSGESHRLPRALRLAAAYTVISAAVFFGCWFFFWCKTLFPAALLHPAEWVWVIFCLRLLLQLVIGTLVLAPALAVAFWLASKILTPEEMRRFTFLTK